MKLSQVISLLLINTHSCRSTKSLGTTSLHQQIHAITGAEEHAREFLFQKRILKTTVTCPSCSINMTLTPCSSTKSTDLLIWRCSPCTRYRNIRIDSILSGHKISFSEMIFTASTVQLWRWWKMAQLWQMLLNQQDLPDQHSTSGSRLPSWR